MRVALKNAASALLVLIGIVAATPAAAQRYQAHGPYNIPFAELPADASRVVSPHADRDWSSASDHWGIELPADFTFRYWGETFPWIIMSGNGGLIPAPAAPPGGTNRQWYLGNDNQALPTPPPLGYGAGIIAPWWDDWSRHISESPRDGGLFYRIEGTAPNRVIRFEWKNVTNGLCTTGSSSVRNCADVKTYNFQAFIYEATAAGTDDSLIMFSYGAPIGPDGTPNSGANTASNSNNDSATIGLEDPTSTEAVTVRACSPNCKLGTHYEADTLRVLGSITTAELLAAVEPSAYSSSATELTIEAQATVHNIGTLLASGIDVEVWLSEDQNLDVTTDTFLESTSIGLVNPGGAASARVTATIPRLSARDYYLCARVDPLDAIAERIESNNIACSTEPMRMGVDLTGSIAIPTHGTPGELIQVPVTVRNNGSEPSGPFTIRAVLSPDGSYDPNFDELFLKSANLAPGQVLTFDEPVRLPMGYLDSSIIEYFAVLMIDPPDAVAELDETNNMAVSSNMLELQRAALMVANASIEFEDPLGCFYDKDVTITYRVCNLGQADAVGFPLSVHIVDSTEINANDEPVDTLPPACPHGRNDECDLEAGEFCYQGLCRRPCEDDSQCFMGGEQLSCLPDRQWKMMPHCQNALEDGNTCRIYERTFTLGSFDRDNQPRPEVEQLFGVMVDRNYQVSELDKGDNLFPMQFMYLCRQPNPDFKAVTVSAPTLMAAGEVTTVTRTIENNGNKAGSAEYRYYLSSNEILSGRDVPLDVLATGGAGVLSLDTDESNTISEIVSIPAWVAPGDYYLGMVIDPDSKVKELDKDDNMVLGSTLIRVESSALRIVTNHLPRATRAMPYTMQLVAAGGTGDYEFSLVDGNLPLNITLSPTGLLSGVAVDDGPYVFTVGVRSGSSFQTKMFGLEVQNPTGPLGVATRSLPPAAALTPYSATLIAVGGVPPYTWEVSGDGLQEFEVLGFKLDEATGTITGTPLREAAQPLNLVFRVRDSKKAEAVAEIPFVVAKQSTLRLGASQFPDGRTGQLYQQCVEAAGGTNPAGYEWEVDMSTVPAGLQRHTTGDSTDARFCLRGEPTECGFYQVALTVYDGPKTDHALRASATLPFNVVCGELRLRTRNSVPHAIPGQPFEHQFEPTAGAEGVRFAFYGGRLPSGLTLDSTGRLSGTVAIEAEPGVYDFVLELSNDRGEYGLAAASVKVVVEHEKIVVTREVEGGCSSAEGGASNALPFGLALLGLAATRLSSLRRARVRN